MSKHKPIVERPVTAQDYLDHFQINPLGQKILADLSMRFYDRSSLVPGDAIMTGAKEGERSVVLFIIQQCLRAQQKED